jgi:hypothetical protein
MKIRLSERIAAKPEKDIIKFVADVLSVGNYFTPEYISDAEVWQMDSGNNWKMNFIVNDNGKFIEIKYRYGEEAEIAVASWLKYLLN